MSSGVQFVGLLIGIACIFIGRAIGGKKGRATLGGVLGFLLGPIGLIIIAVVPKTKEIAAKEAAENERRQVYLSQSRGLPVEPPSATPLSPD
ncbi:MAG: hypothetical protein JWN62_439 [Acidimicrobiales bacterium]|nr:hypothetical protein [Acidimicrobiales bacterium]